MDKLKPCPFCGSEAKTIKIYMHGRHSKIRGPYYVVGCSDPECILYAHEKSARLIFRTRNERFLARRWNRRLNNG